MDLTEKVLDTIERFGMICSGDRVLVAVSGGPDSVCLLDVLDSLKERLDVTLGVVHVDHTTRDGESAADAEFVVELAGRYDLPCDVVRVNIEQDREPGESFELAARRLRYAAFKDVAASRDTNRLATGHTADDQAETVLMRVLRGTGPRGLVGIPPAADRDGITVVRPLIDVWRTEIEQYVAERGLQWRQDRTNTMACYLRNRIRLQLLPELEREFNPAVKAALVRLAELTRDEQDELSRYARGAARAAIEHETDGQARVDRESFRSMPVAIGRLCVMAWSSSVLGTPWHGTADAVDRAVTFLCSDATTGEIHLPEHVCIQLEYDSAVFRRTGQNAIPVSAEQPVVLPVPGRVEVDWAGLAFTARLLPRADTPADIKQTCTGDVHYFDADGIAGQLMVRQRRRGDTFQPVGLGGTIKLSDFFINRKVPARLRDTIPILACDARIVWVVGYAADERCAVRDSTNFVVEARCDTLD